MSRFLLIQLRWMGDVLLTTPAVRLLRQQYPHARIDFLTDAVGAVVLDGNPYIDECIVWRRGVRADLRLFRKLWRTRYDAVVDFRSEHWRTGVQTLLTGAPLRVGYRTCIARNRLYTHELDPDARPRYVPLSKMAMLEPLGVTIPVNPDVRLDFRITEKDRAWAHAFFARFGVRPDETVVAITPISQRHYKRWKIERWADVITSLAQHGVRVLVTHGPGDSYQAQQFVNLVDAPLIWDPAGTSLPQLGALFERCHLWIGNDGGAKHIAVAAGIPTVAVHRYTNSALWTDLTAGSSQIGIERDPVLPCDVRCAACGHLSCLEQIQVEDVALPALALLART